MCAREAHGSSVKSSASRVDCFLIWHVLKDMTIKKVRGMNRYLGILENPRGFAFHIGFRPSRIGSHCGGGV